MGARRSGWDEQAAHFVLEEEVWCGCLAEVALDCSAANEFLSAATEFSNHRVRGNLSCAIFIKPEDQEANATAFDAAIAGLRFGGIAINAPTMAHFGISRLTWGGFAADNSIYDIISGNVVTHNTSMVEFPEKSVTYAPWMIAPTPYWFYDNHKIDDLSKACLQLFGFGGNIPRLLKCLVPAMMAGQGVAI
ncbi:hypothetical protein CYMTET_29161 [Cymbomonas tetramitiformis]|uniref:Aldehyde dehydrogenase domain-containing protein n=1 Tax=Cymbomonas tetramitiformis TaxID=36881 RepID=A0AAE0KV87_9CHLO|nr:hypothetical protein CYMTET_29161 [Cymbomonas tetramitiformis]